MTEPLRRLSDAVLDAQDLESLTRPLLELLEAISGLESTYLTTIDEAAGIQRILFSRNSSKLQIPEGLAVAWDDTLCRRAIEENRPFTDDVSQCWGDSEAARALGIRTYLSQPVRMQDGGLYGTLCGASAAKVALKPETMGVLAMFAKLIGQQIEREQMLQATRRAHAEIQRYSDSLKQSNQDLERFAYLVSHDLQAPLRSIAGFTQLLRDRYAGKLDQAADDYIAFIVQGVTHMQSLISGLLALARAGRQGDPVEMTDLEEILAQVRKQLWATISERKAVITHDPLPEVPAVRLQVNLLLQNLIANAIKFQQQDAPRIHISAQRLDAAWQISVRDNGIGIKPDDQQRIFQIFQRLNPAEQFEGSGIGLSICRRIVEQHGGRIWVESEPGKGSTFHFTLKDPASA